MMIRKRFFLVVRFGRQDAVRMARRYGVHQL